MSALAPAPAPVKILEGDHTSPNTFPTRGTALTGFRPVLSIRPQKRCGRAASARRAPRHARANQPSSPAGAAQRCTTAPQPGEALQSNQPTNGHNSHYLLPGARTREAHSMERGWQHYLTRLSARAPTDLFFCSRATTRASVDAVLCLS
eukprot:gene18326-biopygen21943